MTKLFPWVLWKEELWVLLALVVTAYACPKQCTCFPSLRSNSKELSALKNILTLDEHSISIQCSRAKLHAIPRLQDVQINPKNVVTINVQYNKITKIHNEDLRSYSKLQYLDLSNNWIEGIKENSFDRVPLRWLILDRNRITFLTSEVFPLALQILSVQNNFLKEIPSINSLHYLRTLNLSKNNITNIRTKDFRGLGSLQKLVISANQLETIEDHSFSELDSLTYLDLSRNRLKEVPSTIKNCLKLKKLFLAFNDISVIDAEAFQGLIHLQELVLDGNPLKETHVDAFRRLPSLEKLILKESRNFREFPNLEETTSLQIIRIDRSSLQVIPADLCLSRPRLKSLVFTGNAIIAAPKLSNCVNLRLLDLSSNALEDLEEYNFADLSTLHDLLLQNNHIREIKEHTFDGLTSLQVLKLEFNEIASIDPKAFLPLVSLRDLNLGNNVFPSLPQQGLRKVSHIKVHNNKFLKEFPSPDHFPAVQTLALSYAYHCCPFLGHHLNQKELDEEILENVIFGVEELKDLDMSIWNLSSIWPNIEKSDFETIWANLSLNSAKEAELNELTHHKTTSKTVHCIPQPGPFMPCNDLFDWWTLRCGVWIVFLLALLGNGAVVLVLTFARAKMDVPRFLVLNLAMADLFMGIYLGFLAVVDASTLGQFRMYAIPWQMSTGCQVAGFFGVLSSELSVYTLTVITLERNYAITHAMHLNKRLSLRHAAYIMILGWAFAITMAVLPLIDISDYRKFAICLPFETEGAGIYYVIFLMSINGIAFLILMGCYLKIYCAIRGSQAWNSNDSRIAKRMALLVFTDFLCWAPIAFFSSTAAFGLQLISLEEAKIFTVFIFPLNSCCNPFLYALLTKQFKKDCIMLCKTIEESRVTRGIGRCRHSSNFSNRQTPHNTNSAVDQGSKGDNNTCVCHSIKNDEKKIGTRIRVVACKYFLCSGHHDELSSMGDYSYQQTKSTCKSRRHPSLSSDTCSSSWSEALKKNNMVMSLRLMDKRRPNWYLSRKPSQESTLSSSRNDSSATTASTSTWRISRSSVSSDVSSGGPRPPSKGDPSLRITSLRDRFTDQRTPGNSSRINQLPTVMVMPNSSSPGTWISSLVHGKPKLMRQTAVEREAYFPNKSEIEAPSTPISIKKDNLSCVYEQESSEEEYPHKPHESCRSYLTPHYNCSQMSDSLLCRKLSTISSRSVSIRETDKEDSTSPCRETSPLLERSTRKSKSLNSLRQDTNLNRSSAKKNKSDSELKMAFTRGSRDVYTKKLQEQ